MAFVSTDLTKSWVADVESSLTVAAASITATALNHRFDTAWVHAEAVAA